MGTVWIIKDDGTSQCDDRNKGVSLENMQKDLEALGAKVLRSEKRQDCRAIERMCGAPTGIVNAYEISEEDWEGILKGFVGPNGFRLWLCDTTSEAVFRSGEIPWPMVAAVSQISSVRYAPTTIRELIGRPVRCYHEGDQLTQDYLPFRVNIEMRSGTNIIQDIWFG